MIYAFFLLSLILNTFLQAEVIQETFFISNESGLAFEEIGWYRQDEFTHVLKIERSGSKEVRTLYESGEEKKRWVILPDQEWIYEHGELTMMSLFSEQGRLLEEYSYEHGDEVEKTVFHYLTGGLSYTETFDGDENLLYMDEYRLSSRGRLREVKRIWADNEKQDQTLLLTTSGGNLYEEQHTASGKDLIYRFNSSGKLLCRELWVDNNLSMRERITYAGETKVPVSSVEINYRDNRSIHKAYDEQGRLLRQIVEGDGKRIEVLEFSYDDEGRKSQKVRKSEKGLEKWKYFYDSEGELVQEKYWRRGALEKNTLYKEDDTRIEELFRNKKLFIRITFKRDEKIKEEFIRGSAQ